MTTDTDTPTIPETSEELAEILSDEKLRDQVFSTPETTKEFVDAYAKAQMRDGALSKQITTDVAATVTNLVKNMGSGSDRIDQTQIDEIVKAVKPGVGSQRSASYSASAPGVAAEAAGFDSIGEMTRAIWHKRPPTAGHELFDKFNRLTDISNQYSGTNPETGGFLVPEDFRATIMEKVLEASIVRSRASVINMGSRTTSIPYVDETTHSGSLFGGMTFAWIPESGTITTSTAKFGTVKLEAQKLTGGAAIPNELFSDAPGLTSFIDRSLPTGLAWNEDLAFLTGTGVGEPLGVHTSPALLTITKETGQAASTVVVENLVKMYARMLPSSLGAAVWIANQTLLPQLITMALDVGTGGSVVGLLSGGTVANAPTLSILGRPLLITEKVPALGTANDLSFVDLGMYLVGDRQALTMESSQHSQFMADQTEIKIIERVDGRPWVQSVLTPNAGDTLSPYVVLGVRS